MARISRADSRRAEVIFKPGGERHRRLAEMFAEHRQHAYRRGVLRAANYVKVVFDQPTIANEIVERLT